MSKHKAHLQVKDALLSTRLAQLQGSLGGGPIIPRPEKSSLPFQTRGRTATTNSNGTFLSVSSTANSNGSVSPPLCRSLSLSLSPLPSPRHEGADEVTHEDLTSTKLPVSESKPSCSRRPVVSADAETASHLEPSRPRNRRGGDAGTFEVAAATATAVTDSDRWSNVTEKTRLRQRLMHAETEVRDAKWRRYCAEKECRKVRCRWRICERLHAAAIRRQRSLEQSLEAAVYQVERRTEQVETVEKDRRQHQDIWNKEKEICGQRVIALQNELEETMRLLRAERVMREEDKADLDLERATLRAEREDALRSEARMRAELELMESRVLTLKDGSCETRSVQQQVNEFELMQSCTPIPENRASETQAPQHQVKEDCIAAFDTGPSQPEQGAEADVYENISVTDLRKNVGQERFSSSRSQSRTRRKSNEPISPKYTKGVPWSSPKEESSPKHIKGVRGTRSVERLPASRSPAGRKEGEARLSLDAHLEERRRQREEAAQEASGK